MSTTPANVAETPKAPAPRLTPPADPQVRAMYDYVQERFLWQFYSREKDRTRNINGITEQATRALVGEPMLRGTPDERLDAVDAKVMVDDFFARLPWLSGTSVERRRELMSGLRAALIDIAITRSKNHELTHSLY